MSSAENTKLLSLSEKTVFLTLCICLLLAAGANALGRGVELRPTGEELVSTEPGMTITSIFRVTNTADQSQQFVMKPVLPDGWTMITAAFPFQLDGYESDTRIISFVVPEGAQAGKYGIDVTVRGVTDPTATDTSTIYVDVVSTAKLDVRVVSAPRFVVAGEKYTAVFMVTNTSNSEQKISLSYESAQNFPYTADKAELILKAGESSDVTITVVTQKDIRSNFKHSFFVKAAIEAKGIQIKAEAASYVEVIPTYISGESRYKTVPASISALYSGGMDDEVNESAYQFQLTSRGSLDPEQTRQFELSLKGPDMYDQIKTNRLFYATHDEYILKYTAPKYKITLGDNSYSLSQLTENSFYSRGAGLDLFFGKLSLGGYYSQSRWQTPQENEAGAYVDYQITDRFKLGLNFLSKEEGLGYKKMASIDGQFNIVDRTGFELEYSMGQREDEKDSAFYVNFSSYSKWLAAYAKYTYSGPDFPGTYNDQDSITANVSVPVSAKLSINANARQDRRNLDKNPLKGSATIDRFYELGLNYRFVTNTNVSLDARYETNKDDMPFPTSDYNQKTGIITIAQLLGPFTMNLSAEAGREDDKLNENESSVDKISFSASYLTQAKNSFGLYFYHDNNRDDNGNARKGFTYGASCSYRISEQNSFDIKLEDQKILESSTGSRDTYNVAFNLNLLKVHRITIQGRMTEYAETSSQDEKAFMVQYTQVFNMPVGKKDTIGGVKGHIYDKETGKGIKGAFIVLDGMTTIADSRGNFRFDSVRTGEHYLDVDMSTVASGRIPIEKMPIKVDVLGGDMSHVEIGITRAVSVSGKVVVYKYEASQLTTPGETSDEYSLGGAGETGVQGGSTNLIAAYPLANAIIEIKGEKEIKYGVTRPDGSFDFEDLRPGKWTLSVMEDSLPQYHYPEKTDIEYDLAPGDKETAEIRILPRKRTIRMIHKE